jgi:hypothetical protein
MCRTWCGGDGFQFHRWAANRLLLMSRVSVFGLRALKKKVTQPPKTLKDATCLLFRFLSHGFGFRDACFCCTLAKQLWTLTAPMFKMGGWRHVQQATIILLKKQYTPNPVVGYWKRCSRIPKYSCGRNREAKLCVCSYDLDFKFLNPLRGRFPRVFSPKSSILIRVFLLAWRYESDPESRTH